MATRDTGGVGTLATEAPGLIADAAANKTAPLRRRTLVAVGAGLLLVLLAVVALTAGGSAGGSLDPRSAAPGGSRALAELLRQRGVDVSRGSSAGPGKTVLVPFVAALTDEQVTDLLSSGADVVLVDPGPVPQAQLTTVDRLDVRTRPPGCRLDAAQVAGPARLGGVRHASGNSGTSCYDGTLLTLPAGSVPGGGRLTVVGSPDFLTNSQLDQQGNAALAVGLLDRQPALTWYTARRTGAGTSLTDLLPQAVPWAVLQIVIAVAVIGIWRGRRLGPIVTEPLPVVVRAAETVIGRARLYAAARARDTAAEALRAGCRARLGALLHVDPTGGPAQELISAAAIRTGTEPATVASVLYASGGYRAGESDAALVGLADELDKLEDRARRGTRR